MEPEADKETVHNKLGEILWQKLEQGEYEAAVNEVQAPGHKQYLQHNSLELVPIVTRLLHADFDPHPEREKCIQDLLVHIATIANPKEATLAFLEEIEMHKSVIQFQVMLHPIQTSLMQQISRSTRTVTFSWVFNTLYARIADLKLPTGYHLEGKERKLLDADSDVQDVTSCLQGLTDFYSEFYNKVMLNELAWNDKDSRVYLSMFMLQLYHKPLSYLDVYCSEGDAPSLVYTTCQRLTHMISNLLRNVFKLFPYIKWRAAKAVSVSQGTADLSLDKEEGTDEDMDTEEENKDAVSQLSLSCFFYCVLGQHMYDNLLPCIYSHQYIFISCLPLLANLLQEKEDLPLHKGLVLAKSLLDKLPEKSLPGDVLEAKAHSCFPHLLINVMISCDNKELRLTALAVFRPYLRKFDSVGRRRLIQSLLHSVKHAGALGLVIHELKENVALSIKDKILDPNFSKRNLVSLVLTACSLPDAEMTDLLERSDCILPALNLLIYLFKSDKENKTGIYEALPTLQANYLPQLQKGLKLSKGHYELKLKDLESTAVRGKDDASVSVSVGGSVMPSLLPEQEKTVVETAICSLDMMQCVLARAVQATEGKL